MNLVWDLVHITIRITLYNVVLFLILPAQSGKNVTRLFLCLSFTDPYIYASQVQGFFLNICSFRNLKNCVLESDVCLWRKSWFLIFEFLMRWKREVENWSANMNNLPTSARKICSSSVQSLYSVVFELLFHNSHISIFIGHAHRTYKTGQENQNSILNIKLN